MLCWMIPPFVKEQTRSSHQPLFCKVDTLGHNMSIPQKLPVVNGVYPVEKARHAVQPLVDEQPSRFKVRLSVTGEDGEGPKTGETDDCLLGGGETDVGQDQGLLCSGIANTDGGFGEGVLEVLEEEVGDIPAVVCVVSVVWAVFVLVEGLGDDADGYSVVVIVVVVIIIIIIHRNQLFVFRESGKSVITPRIFEFEDIAASQMNGDVVELYGPE